MICDGDRVLVCLSGGKESLSLLHTLHQFQFYSKSKVSSGEHKYHKFKCMVLAVFFGFLSGSEKGQLQTFLVTTSN